MSLVGLAPTEWYVYFFSPLVDVSVSVHSANIFIQLGRNASPPAIRRGPRRAPARAVSARGCIVRP